MLLREANAKQAFDDAIEAIVHENPKKYKKIHAIMQGRWMTGEKKIGPKLIMALRMNGIDINQMDKKAIKAAHKALAVMYPSGKK